VGPSVAPEVPEGLEILYERTLDCVHCGLCLPSCPTYRETGRELSSPRGRIYLARGVAEGRVPLAGVAADEMYRCLGCRACETACPSGVRYGELLEEARAAVERAGARTGLARGIEWAALRGVLPHRRRLHALVSLLALAQRLGLDRLTLPFLPASLRTRHRLMPEVPPRAERRPLASFTPAQGKNRGRVALLEGCVMPELFGTTNRATVRVLVRNGFDVLVPASQGCCGALQAHAGDADTARRLLERNLAAFSSEGFAAVIVNSAGCGAHLRGAEHWLPGEGAHLAGRIRDVTEFLVEVGIRPPSGRVDARVCYDDPCHLIHGQGVASPPRELLASIPGLELVAHEDATVCCGAAGIYNLTHPEMSEAVLTRKIDALAAVDPDLIATGNPGCLMQIARGVRERGLRARVVHPVELLDRAYGEDVYL
jgi:glycolate oxidase iron-sulfur subunit